MREPKKAETRKDEVRFRTSDPGLMFGKYIAENVFKKYTEDFLDENSGEVVSIERQELLFEKGRKIDEDLLSRIMFSQQADGISEIEVSNQRRLADLQVFKACFVEAIPAPEKPKDITDEVKTYEDACRVLGYNVTEDSELRKAGFRPDEIARRKLEIITEALNEGWAPDWNNTNEYKYYPWFYIQPHGGADKPAGLAYADANITASNTYAYFGSRLCYKTRNLATYAGKQFKELYEIMLLK